MYSQTFLGVEIIDCINDSFQWFCHLIKDMNYRVLSREIGHCALMFGEKLKLLLFIPKIP